MTSRPQLLYLEDDLTDAELLQDTLLANGLACDITRVDTECGFISALQQDGFDLILADYTLPYFDGLSALKMAQQQKPDLPFIFVSGTMGEETAIDALKMGATDYVLKTRLARLAPAVLRALREARERLELRSAERELRDVIETIPAVAWSALADGSNAFVNRRWTEFTGLSAEQTAGTGWHAAIHADDVQRHIDRWRMCIATGEPLEIEVRMRRADGQYRWHLWRGVPLRDERRSVVKWYGVLTDIEDRKRAEEALRSSEQRFRLIVDNIPGLVCTMSATGEVQLVSRQVLQYFGKSPEELKSWATSDAVHPDDLPRVISAWASSIEIGHPYDIEHRCRRGDGTYRWFHVRALPVRDAESRITCWYNLLTDIDDRKRAEEALQQTQFYLREAQKLTHTGSWVFNAADRTWTHLSAEWYLIFGFNPADGTPNWERRLDRIHPDDRLDWKNTIERAMVEKTDYDLTFRIVLPGGIVKWIRTVGHPVLTATGDLVQFLGSSTDITDHKQAEQEHERLRQLEAELAHIDRVSMLGEMAASLAHEIKQPITAAITCANSCIEWLAHDPPNIERALATATKIDRYGTRAAEIIDRMRSFYRKSPPQRELVDVNRIIHEMLTLLKGEATRSSITMRTDLPAEVPKIMADRVQLQQVFMNLMLNGIEAMEDSGGELTVKSQLQDAQCQFSVSDTGPGLPVGNVDQIFGAFFTTKPQGSGMGLAISRSIVESHGGRLWATANEARGATFHFTLSTEVR
jgi:PAS domain S-box-containing protein